MKTSNEEQRAEAKKEFVKVEQDLIDSLLALREEIIERHNVKQATGKEGRQ